MGMPAPAKRADGCEVDPASGWNLRQCAARKGEARVEAPMLCSR